MKSRRSKLTCIFSRSLRGCRASSTVSAALPELWWSTALHTHFCHAHSWHGFYANGIHSKDVSIFVGHYAKGADRPHAYESIFLPTILNMICKSIDVGNFTGAMVDNLMPKICVAPAFLLLQLLHSRYGRFPAISD